MEDDDAGIMQEQAPHKIVAPVGDVWRQVGVSEATFYQPQDGHLNWPFLFSSCEHLSRVPYEASAEAAISGSAAPRIGAT